MSGRVLILSEDDDEHVAHVAPLLSARGADVVVFDPWLFPARARLTAALSPAGAVRRRLVTADRVVDLDGLTSVWIRRPHDPTADPSLADARVRDYVAHESAAFAADLWESLDCPVLPGTRSVVQRAEHKICQLAEAGRLGFELPPTLITTDPDELVDFYGAHDGNIVTKVIDRSCAHQDGDRLHRYTEPVSTRDIIHADSIRLCPIVAQRYVEKAIELRVTVIRDDVFAAEIHSQEANRARFDWRHYDLATQYLVHHLPGPIRRRCVALVERLGLGYAAIDLILTPDGRYVFLEANPGGQYLWIEEATGLRISDALCDLLLADRAPTDPSLLLAGV